MKSAIRSLLIWIVAAIALNIWALFTEQPASGQLHAMGLAFALAGGLTSIDWYFDTKVG